MLRKGSIYVSYYVCCAVYLKKDSRKSDENSIGYVNNHSVFSAVWQYPKGATTKLQCIWRPADDANARQGIVVTLKAFVLAQQWFAVWSYMLTVAPQTMLIVT